MDHLPHGGHRLPFKIPYLCKEPYNHKGEWLDYPDTQGFNLDHIRFHTFHHYSPEIVPAFLQSWLYFGLLFSILPINPVVSDFLTEDERGRKFITTSKLPMYLTKWKLHAKALSKEEKLSLWRKNFLILDEARSTINVVAGWPESMILSYNPLPPVSREVGLSFVLLGRALEVANRQILNPEDQEGRIPWAEGSLLLEHMEIQGWCPFLVAGVDHNLSIEGKYFAATMGPPKVQRNHRKCTDNVCMYRSPGIQHVTPTCECIMFTPDIDKMEEILAEKKLPLLRFVTNSDFKEGRLEVVRGEEGTKYVAMSHVWSDGLGNFEGNSMPGCQLSRIQKAIDSLYHDELAIYDSNSLSIPFWMDTLLIPNDPKLEKIKKDTIINMTQIYKNANNVVVIDSEVATCSRNSDPLDILHCILLSNWLRRLWTLQEGVFAHSIHFLLSDGTTSLGALMYSRDSSIGVGLEAWTREYFMSRFAQGLENIDKPVLNDAKKADVREEESRLEFLALSPEERKPKDLDTAHEDPLLRAQREQIRRRWNTEAAIVGVIRAIADRVSTFQSDEALCIALLLGVDVSEIIGAQQKLKAWEEAKKAHPDDFKCPRARDERLKLESEPMLILLRLLDGSIPPGIILTPGPYQNTPGFRWAPKSFLAGPEHRDTLQSYPLVISEEYPSTNMWDRHPSSLCQEGGLRVVFPGLLLGKVKENCYLDWAFVIDTLPSMDLNAKDEIIEGKPPRIWRCTYKNNPDSPPWTKIRPSWRNSTSIGIIICSYQREWRNNALSGLMVRLKGEVIEKGKKSMHVERICKVVIMGAPVYDDQSWIKEPEKRVSGSWLPMTQQWCVD